MQILEDQSDHVGRDIAIIKKDMATLVLANKNLAGRLIRAENTIEQELPVRKQIRPRPSGFELN